MDLARPNTVRAAMHAIRPCLVINAAAYTAVDAAEADPAACHATNATGAGVVAEEAFRIGAPIVHYSSDYVFDGRKMEPYTEQDSPNPLNVYGVSKLEGERYVAAANPAHLILRTSWIYGLRGRNFLRTIRQRARTQSLRIVCDQIGAPTPSRAIAQATALILTALGGCRDRLRDEIGGAAGIYHLSASGSTSWYEFARQILDLGTRNATNGATLVPISTVEYGAPASRPPYSVLDNTRIRTRFDIELPDWKLLLDLVLDELAAYESEGERGWA
jgi:dTDP-4-dehydrorhamnose reductase